MAVQSCAIGHLTLHPHRELLDGRAPLTIGGRALDLLSVLAAADGCVVSKDELLAAVWGGAIVEDNALQAQVSAVRKALGSEAARLVTVHGRGYRLELDGNTAAATASPQPSAVAVFAFENLTGDSANDYLTDGIPEELIASLAYIPDLVVPAFSSLGFGGTGTDLRQIARERGIGHVLEGRLRASGGRLQVAADLIDAASGRVLWTRLCEGDIDRLLGLQNDLARSIAAALGRRLEARPGGPASSEALRLVFQARRLNRMQDPAALGRSTELARKATVLDPGYGKAWESLAGIAFIMSSNGLFRRSTLDEARLLAERALALDPNLASTHTILGGIDAMTGDWLGAAGHFARGRELDQATGARAVAYALHVLLPAGRVAEAAGLADRCITFPAARSYPILIHGLCSSLAGDLADARHRVDAALIAGVPTRRPLFEMVASEEAYARGAFAEALAPVLASLPRTLEMPEAEGVLRRVFAALARIDDPVAASQAAARLFAAADRSGTMWLYPESAGPFLLWQVRLGALDAAFAVARRIIERWRETGVLANSSLIPFWGWDMERFRSDARFQKIVADLGLFGFWEQYGPPDGHAVRNGQLLML